MSKRLNSKMLQYMSKVRSNTPGRLAATPSEVAKMPSLCQKPYPTGTPAESRQDSGQGSQQGALTQQAAGRAKSSLWLRRLGSRAPELAARRSQLSGRPPEHSSLASLASSMRSEEREKRVALRNMPSGLTAQEADLHSLCQQSCRSRQTTRDSIASEPSFVNFMQSGSAHESSGSSLASSAASGSLAGKGLEQQRRSSLELRPGAAATTPQWLQGSQESQQQQQSRSVWNMGPTPAAVNPFSPPLSRASSAEVSSPRANTGLTAAGRPFHAHGRLHSLPPSPAASVSGSKPDQAGSSRGSSFSSAPGGGLLTLGHARHSSQPLISIRSGEVELFVRHQLVRPASPKIPPPVPELAPNWPPTSSSAPTSSAGSMEAAPEEGTCGEGALRPDQTAKQRMKAAMGAVRRACSMDLPAPRGAVRASMVSLSMYSCAITPVASSCTS